jgi:hypothetical protein
MLFFEEVNIGFIDKMPTRNTTNTNTCILSSCCVKCYYKLKPLSMSLYFNLRVKNIILLPTLLYFVWVEFATKKFMYTIREVYVFNLWEMCLKSSKFAMQQYVLHGYKFRVRTEIAG